MFNKYPSIENHYRKPSIDWFLDQFPELKEETFAIQEKIHGSNIQFIFTPGDDAGRKPAEVQLASRSKRLKPGENFFGVRQLLPKYRELTEMLAERSQKEGIAINLYGEIFGPGVQKGVNYGREKRILFFDVAIDGKWLAPAEMEQFLAGYEQFLIPTIKVVQGLESAINEEAEIVSKVNPVAGNIVEGIVIKPRNKAYVTSHGDIFMLKKKNKKFEEKRSAKRPAADKSNPQADSLKAEFERYITDARVQAVFSKLGPIESKKQTGHYVRHVLDDAKEDFLKDHGPEVAKLNKKAAKKIFNAGSKVFELLKEYL
ncbi:MAG: RNA ligase family protein [Ardenticatenaceae bacterium]